MTKRRPKVSQQCRFRVSSCRAIKEHCSTSEIQRIFGGSVPPSRRNILSWHPTSPRFSAVLSGPATSLPRLKHPRQQPTSRLFDRLAKNQLPALALRLKTLIQTVRSVSPFEDTSRTISSVYIMARAVPLPASVAFTPSEVEMEAAETLPLLYDATTSAAVPSRHPHAIVVLNLPTRPGRYLETLTARVRD